MDISGYIKDNRLNILVKPGSSKDEIVCFDHEKQRLKVRIKAPAEENKANMEIIRFFRKLLKKKISIVSGKTSRKKTLFIQDS